MRRLAISSKSGFAAMAVAMIAAPAVADVKTGVDAWSAGKYDIAVKEWRAPAQQGDADAQYDLGYAYLSGKGVDKNIDTALIWLKKAAAQGHLRAADSVGHALHFQGKIAEALPYLQASAARGEPRSQYLLGIELFNGTNIAKDWVRAYALMTRASAAGMEMATRTLPKMDQYIPMEQRQQAMVLAGELERDASNAHAAQIAFPIDTKPSKPSTKPVSVPPSQIPPATTPGFPSAQFPVAGEPVSKPPVAKPVAKPALASNPNGAWRIQLGAFGQEDSARKLWSGLEAKVADFATLQPYLVAGGKVTRLQAGGFASKAAAESMCNKVRAAVAGQACIAVPR